VKSTGGAPAVVLSTDDILAEEKSLRLDDGRVPTPQDFKRVVLFLRDRFKNHRAGQTGDEQYFRVGFLLDEMKSVQLYFQKRDLYLLGWTIDRGTSGQVVWPGAQPTPEGLQAVTRDARISLEYTEDAKEKPLSGCGMYRDLTELHAYLYKAVRRGDTARPKPPQAHFHRLAMATSEMARFESFRTHFSKHLNEGWSPGEGISVTLADRTSWTTPPFSWVVGKWDKLCKKADGPQEEALTWQGVPVTPQQATAILGDGVRIHR
jgi:hypothetical protein